MNIEFRPMKKEDWISVADIDSEIVGWAGLTPSLKIHENLGFRKVGFREKIGKMDCIWKDTILLERRSKIVGTDIY